MGGFAIAVDWERAVNDRAVDRMRDSLRHRGPAGVQSRRTAHAGLVEARLRRDGASGWEITTLGSLTLVGDLRLWNRTELEAMGGVDSDADDRTALIAAFREAGEEVMAAVDGDFAFAIWDDSAGTVFAARDRFGVKPVFLELADAGIRLASEARQILAFDERPVEPDPYTIEAFLSGRSRSFARTFDVRIRRLGPGESLLVTEATVERRRYWDPASVTPVVSRSASEIGAGFRDRLIDSVRRRLEASNRTLAHLSGGLDSSSIAASASALTDRGLDPASFVTVSARFPGTDADESSNLDEIVAGLPFGHVDFEPRPGSIDQYAEDMDTVGAPVAHPVRALTATTREIAADLGADLVLTGNGGDEIASDTQVLSSRLRMRRWKSWATAVGTFARDDPKTAASAAVISGAQALPRWMKRPLGRTELRSGRAPESHSPRDRTAAQILDSIRDPRLTFLLETQEAMFAEAGVEVSHPYLDRDFVEWVLSIPPTDRPVSTMNKTMTRLAFSDDLPTSVVEQRRKTRGDTLVRRAFEDQAGAFEERFPNVPAAASAFIDERHYESLHARAGEDLGAAAELWRVWSLMLWLGDADSG